MKAYETETHVMRGGRLVLKPKPVTVPLNDPLRKTATLQDWAEAQTRQIRTMSDEEIAVEFEIAHAHPVTSALEVSWLKALEAEQSRRWTIWHRRWPI